MVAKIKLMIVDDVLMVRLGLQQMLRKIDTIEIIAEADNGQIFLDKIAINRPDVVLMDVKMPVMNGIEATKKGLNTNPQMKVIALSADCNESSIDEMVLSGAKGFLLKSVGIAELQKAIETVLNGGTYYSNELVTAYKLK